LKEFDKQREQEFDEVAPRIVDQNPETQLVQELNEVAPKVEEYVPTEQCTQTSD
jgi:hypothetical protein